MLSGPHGAAGTTEQYRCRFPLSQKSQLDGASLTDPIDPNTDTSNLNLSLMHAALRIFKVNKIVLSKTEFKATKSGIG